MSSLNLEQHEPTPAKKKNNRNLKIFLGIGALIAVPAIGTTLAAQITVNTGTAIQFGQGISQATACDSDITVTPSVRFTNAANSGSFYLGTVQLSGIADACSGKTFTIRAFDNTNGSNTPLTISAGGATTTGLVFTPTLQASPTVAVQTSANQTATVTYTSGSSSITITVVTDLLASSIYKFTIETN